MIDNTNRRLAAVTDDSEWIALERDWVRGMNRRLRRENISEKTIELYIRAYRELAEWALVHNFASPRDLAIEDLDDFMDYRLSRTTRFGKQATPSGVNITHGGLCAFFLWLTAKDNPEIRDPQALRVHSVMSRVVRPKARVGLVEVIEPENLSKLLDTCHGIKFAQRRDTAIIRVLLDTGMRKGEVAGLTVDDVDLDQQVIKVRPETSKSRRPRPIWISDNTVEALEVYLDARRKHPSARLPDLWLTSGQGNTLRGSLGYSGLHQMLKRRAAAAGITDLHAHKFRHTAATAYLKAGGSSIMAQRRFGWTDDTMVKRYTNAEADNLAIAEAQRLDLGNRI